MIRLFHIIKSIAPQEKFIFKLDSGTLKNNKDTF